MTRVSVVESRCWGLGMRRRRRREVGSSSLLTNGTLEGVRSLSLLADLALKVLFRTELEVLVKRLRGHVARLQKQIDSHAVDIDRLRAQRQRGWTDEVATLREGMEALSNEVDQVRKLVETLAEEQGSRARLPQQTRRPSPKLFSTTEPKQTRKEEAEELDREIKRANAILGSCQQTCADCRRRVSSTTAAPKRRPAPRYATEDEGYADDEEEVDEYGGKLPPQTVLSRVLADLEADFTSHKRCVLPTVTLGSFV